MENYIQVKELNSFQKIRLNMWRKKQNINLQKYDKLPDYIKYDELLVEKIIEELKTKINPEKDEFMFSTKKIPDAELFTIPMSRIVENIKNNKIDLYYLSTDSIVKILKFDVSIFEKVNNVENICLNIIKNWNDEKELFSKICNRNNKLKIPGQQRDEKFEEMFIDILEREYPDEFEKVLSQNINEFSIKNQNKIIEKNPSLVSSMSNENQMKFLINKMGEVQKTELFQYASLELQYKFVEKNKASYMEYASPRIQKENIEKDIANLRYASIDVIKDYVKASPENLRYVPTGKATEIVNQNLELFDKMNVFAKKYFVNYNVSEGHIDRISKILQKDINNIKFCEMDTNDEKFWRFNNFSNMTDNEIKKLFLHSKNFDAYGSIFDYNTLHSIGWGNAGYARDYRNSYLLTKYMDLLNKEKVAELIKVDSNYILPYIQSQTGRYNSEEINVSKRKAKELFIVLYGINKLKDYEKYIDEIFSMQEKYESSRYDVDFKNKSKDPVHELKVLFNPTILNTEGIDQLYEEYFARVKEGKDSRNAFYNIIEKSYGKDARNILESRPGLDVHEIDSLEVFDNRIKSIFEGKAGLSYEAFVHNCLSYNIENFSGFLDIVKNEEKNKNFSTYYEILATIMGDNIETAQKAITQFDYIEEILKSVKNVELTEKQEQNLLSVLCSNSNPCNVISVEELDCYEERLFLEESLSDRNDAFKLHFGKNKFIEEVFDLSDDELEKYKYTNSEKIMLKVAKSCFDDKNYNFLETYKNTPSNPIALYSAMERTRKYQMDIFNSKLLTKEKLNKMAEKSKDKDNPNVYITSKDDIKTYHIMVDKEHGKLPRSIISTYCIWKNFIKGFY